MDDYTQQNSTSTQLIEQVTQQFEPISLSEMDTVKLMNRIDTKFLINSVQLPELLSQATSHYRILEIDGKRITPYSTVYFDTEDTIMYIMHHNGKLNRYKLRMRSYINSGQTFLEVKRKNNKGRTNKKRISIDNSQFETQKLIDDNLPFLKKRLPYSPELLKPKLQNYFKRITLVDKAKSERITIDMGLNFRNVTSLNEKALDNLIIIEMKQDGACKSKFRELLNEKHILPGSMSKYCLGMVLVNPEIKKNRFKNKLRKINKITQREYVTI